MIVPSSWRRNIMLAKTKVIEATSGVSAVGRASVYELFESKARKRARFAGIEAIFLLSV